MAAGETMNTERWEREAPKAWEVAGERAHSEVRTRQLEDGIDHTLDSIDALTIEVQQQHERVELLEKLLNERSQRSEPSRHPDWMMVFGSGQVD